MTEDVRYDLLDEPLLTIGDAAGRRAEGLSLPALYAALVRDAVGDFPALRAHQRHPWHAFLVQVGALALHRAGLAEPPDDAEAWRQLLRGLTPGQEDTAWALVAPASRPALLQPAVPEGNTTAFSEVATPDELDVLVSAKHHDVKNGRMYGVKPEHWLFALVSLQTQQGYSGGAGTLQGISRMNGGNGSRSAFGISIAGSIGGTVVRDLLVLLDARESILQGDGRLFRSHDGIALVWLEPWDGAKSLSPKRLDPFYVEVCRRVRLESRSDGSLVALTKPSSAGVSRIDTDLLPAGRTGDLWTPLVTEKKALVAYSAPQQPVRYHRLVGLLFDAPRSGAVVRATAQVLREFDPPYGLALIARALVRDRMKTGTHGYYERRIPVSRTLRRFLGPLVVSDLASRTAHARVIDVGTFQKHVFRPAALTVYTSSPSQHERRRDDKSAARRADKAVERFDAVVDARFFADLDAELRAAERSPADAERVRAAWLLRLRATGRRVLDEVLAGAPSAAMRQHRTRVRAERQFAAAFRRHFGARVECLGVAADASPANSDSLHPPTP